MNASLPPSPLPGLRSLKPLAGGMVEQYLSLVERDRPQAAPPVND
jgi:hypothetical protein